MRTSALLVAVLVPLAACGGDSKQNTDDGGGGSGDAPPGDAPGDAITACPTTPLPACSTPRTGTNVTFTQFPGNFGDGPVLVTSPKNDPRQFVVGRNGIIRVIENGQLVSTPFYNLGEDDGELASGDEQGLLGLAFHPEYACNKTFFIFYTRPNANVVARCTTSDNANVANEECTPILVIDDFAGNHNGGMMEFGPDGFLYIGTGDGGGGGDPRRNGQALVDNGGSRALLGKMLRIDVDRQENGKQYAIPASNPFATGGNAPEIFMYGLRNPWRWAFDKQTGDLWIGDVGQGRSEELTVLRAGEQSGKNLGWSIWEGTGCCTTQSDRCEQQGMQQTCDMNAPSLVFPQREYLRNTANWVSIIAGEPYRGTCMPDLVGWTFYTDWLSRRAGLHRARLMSDNSLEVVDYPTNTPQLPDLISSIHADASGELWVTTVGGGNQGGSLYRIGIAP